jgi:hypothetical protein
METFFYYLHRRSVKVASSGSLFSVLGTKTISDHILAVLMKRKILRSVSVSSLMATKLLIGG